MKKFFSSIIVFFAILLLASCSLFVPPSSSQGQSGSGGQGGMQSSEYFEPFDCYYSDDQGILEFRNFEQGTLIITIDGVEYDVKSPTFDLNTLGLPTGRYMATVQFYLNGDLYFEAQFEFYQGKEEFQGSRITFYDHNGMFIKEIFLPYEAIFDESVFPLITDKPGVNYSWEYDAELGSKLNGDIEIHLVATYVEYDIIYQLNGGSFEYDVTNTYTIQTEDFYLESPVKYGYMFDGWYENSSFSGDPIIQIDTSAAKDVYVYAKWIELSAEVKEIIDVFNDNIKEDVITISGNSGGQTFELAIDLSGQNLYYHYKENNKVSEVVLNNTIYYYSDMSCIGKDFEKENYRDPLSLKNLSNMIISTSKEENNGTITYNAKMKDNAGSLVIVVKDGKLSSITAKSGNQKEEYNFSYSIKKESVDTSKFTPKLEVHIFEVLVTSEGVSDPFERANEYANKGSKLSDFPTIVHELENMPFEYIGLFLDLERKQEVTLDYVLKESVNVYIFRYDNFDTAMYALEFTINLYCDCSECNGKVSTYENITIDTVNTVKHFENFSKDMQEPFHKVENNKIIYGWFMSENKDLGEAYIMNYIYEYAEKNNRKEPLIIDLYTFEESAETVVVKEYCDCELHSDKGYVESYFVKGSWIWQWTTKHEKEGYRCEGVSLRSDLQDITDGFEVYENTSIYYKWIIDTRINVTVYDQTDKGSQVEGEKLYLEQQDLYNELYQRYRYGYNDQILEGMYLDKNYTIEFTKDTLVSDGAKIYIKWAPGKRVQFVTINGDWEEFLIPENWDINSVDWSKYTGSQEIIEAITAEDMLFNLVMRSSRYGETISIFEFYKNENRTQKITSFKDVNTVYIGYKNTVTVSFVCDDDCNDIHESHPYNFYNDIGFHTIQVDGIVYKVSYYYDEDFTKPVEGGYSYQPNDFTVYGKKEKYEFDVKINCHCLNHPNGIEGTYNSVAEALNDCDYGFVSAFAKYPVLYVDESYNSPFYFGNEYSYAVLPELHVRTDGRATIYCDCDIEGHDGQGYQVVLAYFQEDMKGVYESIAMQHHEIYMGAPIHFEMYLDENHTKPIYSDHEINDGEVIYISIEMEGDYKKITINYEEEFTQKMYEMVGNYVYLPNSYDKYKVVGYYLDKEYTIEAPCSFEGDYYGMYIEEDLTLYAELELAEIATLEFEENGKIVVSEFYIFSNNKVSTLYGSIRPKFGYRSYIVDEFGHRVDPQELMKPQAYYVHFEALEGYITITIECGCQFCLYSGDYYDYHDNGDISMKRQNNKFLVLPGEAIEEYIINYYNLHEINGMDYMIGNAIISLTKGGEALDQAALFVWDGNYDSVSYRYIYYTDTTLYFRYDGTDGYIDGKQDFTGSLVS